MPPPNGMTLGRAIVAMLVEKDRATMHDRAQVDAEHRTRGTTGLMETMERELAPLLDGLFSRMRDDDTVPDELRDAIRQATDPGNQTDVILQFLFLAPAIYQLAGQVAQIYWQETFNSLNRDNPDVPTSPAFAAEAVVKGHVTGEQGALEAAASGIDRDRFNVMVGVTGNPPGPETLMAMLRRAIIGDDQFAQGIRQGLIKTEWTDELRQLRWGPPSAAQAILGAVQNHISADLARTIVGEEGIDPFHFSWLYENAGRPPGTVQMLHLLNRGEVNVADVVQSIRESDIKDKYIDSMLALRVYLPPVRTVVAMTRHGAITDEHATQLLTENGVRPEDIAGYLAEAHTTRASSVHELSVSQVRSAYTDGAIDRPTAIAHLTALRYSAQDATFLVDLADAALAHTEHQNAVHRVRSLFTGGHITRTDASSDLDRLGVVATQRNQLLAIWDVERSTVRRELSVAQLQESLRRGYLTEVAFGDRLVAMGYDPSDADTLTSLAVRQLSTAQTQKAFKRGDISETQFRERMAARGLTHTDTSLLVAQTIETDTEPTP